MQRFRDVCDIMDHFSKNDSIADMFMLSMVSESWSIATLPDEGPYISEQVKSAQPIKIRCLICKNNLVRLRPLNKVLNSDLTPERIKIHRYKPIPESHY